MHLSFRFSPFVVSRTMQRTVQVFADCKQVKADYEGAVTALNGLQSNAAYLQVAEKQKLSHSEEFSNTILQMQKYLQRCNISLDKLDTLPVIHVAGTKGKGSTCAMCESILRHHGLKTGFYSSPHLLEVRERVRINGKPLKKQVFANYFWLLYDLLDKEKADAADMPLYFRFLTILAFRVFLEEKVDVAIIEVGIGGEYDCTNVLRKVPVVGITSLGLDHTNILGDSIDRIAWNKAGIMKPGSRVFTVPQQQEAMAVLLKRSKEKQACLEVISFNQNLRLAIHNSKIPPDIFNANATLAVALAQAWINIKENGNALDISNSDATKLGLETCVWPGRYHILSIDNAVYYIDGAHTFESTSVCANWFKSMTKNSRACKVLIFNATGGRSSGDMLNLLRSCEFDEVFFVPNRAFQENKEDMKNFNISDNQQLQRCHDHYEIWMGLETGNTAESVKIFPSVSCALDYLSKDIKYHVLVTGSLHLVGAVLSVIDPDLERSYEFH